MDYSWSLLKMLKKTATSVDKFEKKTNKPNFFLSAFCVN